MKKSFVLFIAILLLGTSVVFFGQNMILAEKDNVKITENVLYGDKSVVEGVKLDLHNHYETQIFWDTTYVMGENPKTNTNYTFHQWRQNNQEYSWNGAIHFYNDMQEIGWDNSTVHASEGLETAIKELQDSIGASESGTKMLFLKDYKDYYTFDISFQTPYSTEAEDDIRFYYNLSKPGLKRELAYVAKNS